MPAGRLAAQEARGTGSGPKGRAPSAFGIRHAGVNANERGGEEAAAPSSGVHGPEGAGRPVTRAAIRDGLASRCGRVCTPSRLATTPRARTGQALGGGARPAAACRCKARGRRAGKAGGPAAPTSALSPTSGAFVSAFGSIASRAFRSGTHRDSRRIATGAGAKVARPGPGGLRATTIARVRTASQGP